MVDQSGLDVENKNHFIAIAARSMRQILVDHARKKMAEKRGGDNKDVTYIDELMKAHHEADELINLDNELDKLAELDERMAQIVTLRFFGQMTVRATASVLGISERTVKREWAKARGWLYKELKN
jgi:RNA polymerase sigma factor (TIGR02999 family)